MRPTLIAALVLSPALLHAQANVSAQPKTSDAAPALQARLAEPKALYAAAPADHSTATASLRVSTGVVGPKLIHTVEIKADSDWRWRSAGKYRTAVVEMIVDETGTPTNLKIVQSAGEELDKNVLAAVSQYRFRPATVSHQPAAVPVDLTVEIVNPLL